MPSSIWYYTGRKAHPFAGDSIAELCRKHGISGATFYKKVSRTGSLRRQSAAGSCCFSQQNPLTAASFRWQPSGEFDDGLPHVGRCPSAARNVLAPSLCALSHVASPSRA